MQNYLLLLASAILIFQACFWGFRLRDLVLFSRHVPLIDPDDEAPLPHDVPLVSVVVPAHNEERTLRSCLESLFNQDYPRFEVILVDDRSEDATPAIARSYSAAHANFTIVSIKHLPEGWLGKCHALNSGVRRASGEWLAFVDADTRLHPATLRQCYSRAAQARVSMITLTPRLILKHFWEKVCVPAFASMSCVILPFHKINDASSAVASANGMFFMITREAYEQIGGHRAVRAVSVEDIAIGRRVKAAGLGLLFANGRCVLETRMYSRFEEAVQGWSRILGGSMDHRLSTAVRYLAMHVLMSPPASLFALWVYGTAGREVWPHLWFVLPALCVMQMLVVPPLSYAQHGIPPRYAGFLPLGVLMLIWLFAGIIKKIVLKEPLQWQGTCYDSVRYEPARACSDTPDIVQR
ncbi:MAG: glycosyltransferase [Desulfomonile tiedjei]|nr:glycosyltransferase [Desulfomonile tiedjei]